MSECPECGGQIYPEVSSTRWMSRKKRFELIPCIPLHTCVDCGAQWLSTDEVLMLERLVRKPRFCEVCLCENCRNGTQTVDFRIRSSDGRWWCDVCYLFDAEDEHSPLWPRPPWVQIETMEQWQERLARF